MTPRDCPLCQSPASMIEHLSGQWYLCNACARCYRLDAEGHVVTSADTNQAPTPSSPAALPQTKGHIMKRLTAMALMVAGSLGTSALAQSGSSVVPAPGMCRTIVLPETATCAAHGGNCGASVDIPPFSEFPQGFHIVEYHPPASVVSVGLEFWFHQFPAGAVPGTQYILTYLNEPNRWARRLFHNWNGDPADRGVPKMFALSTFVHPKNGEWLTVNWLNTEDRWLYGGYFAITIRECY